MSSLTPRQLEIFNFIRERIEHDRLPPTVREIGAKFGIRSLNGVSCHLQVLRKKGVIETDRGLSRAIRIVDGAWPKGMPLLTVGRLPQLSEVLAKFYQTTTKETKHGHCHEET